VSTEYYRKKFSVDILERFAAPFKGLVDAGYLDISGETVRLKREGLLQVDRLLHGFFLPEHRNVRYA
jgi:oxygen-independent coproporphyrinogen III oxidase